jgi:hypothetical protein
VNPLGLTRALKHLDGMSCTIAPATVGDAKTVGFTLHKPGHVSHASLTPTEARAIAASLIEHARYIDPRPVEADLLELREHLDPPPPPASGFEFGSVYDGEAGSRSPVTSVYDRPAK